MKTLAAAVIFTFGVTAVVQAQSFDAKNTFKQKCAMCHGADGKQPTMIGKNVGAVDLSSDKVQKMSDRDLHETIEKGKGKMPAYGSSLGDKNVDAMVKYVRAIKK